VDGIPPDTSTYHEHAHHGHCPVPAVRPLRAVQIVWNRSSFQGKLTRREDIARFENSQNIKMAAISLRRAGSTPQGNARKLSLEKQNVASIRRDWHS